MIGGRSRLLQGDRIAEGLPDPNILPCHDPLAHRAGALFAAARLTHRQAPT